MSESKIFVIIVLIALAVGVHIGALVLTWRYLRLKSGENRVAVIAGLGRALEVILLGLAIFVWNSSLDSYSLVILSAIIGLVALLRFLVGFYATRTAYRDLNTKAARTPADDGAPCPKCGSASTRGFMKPLLRRMQRWALVGVFFALLTTLMMIIFITPYSPSAIFIGPIFTGITLLLLAMAVILERYYRNLNRCEANGHVWEQGQP